MKKKIFFIAIAMAVLTVFKPRINAAVTSKATAQTPSTSQTYSCGPTFEPAYYCAAGKTCNINAPLCIMNIKIGGSSITETLYALNVPTNEFKAIPLNATQGTQLPITKYPDLGKRVAYTLTPLAPSKAGNFVGVPFNIVIQTELPNDAFINTLLQGIGSLTDPAQKDAATKLATTLQQFKATGQGINTVYRSIPALGETKYKLYHVRVPGTANASDAQIFVTPWGNLQFYEATDKPNEQRVETIDTGTLIK